MGGRIQRHKKQFGEGSAVDVKETMTAKEKFKINTFNVITDRLNCALKNVLKLIEQRDADDIQCSYGVKSSIQIYSFVIFVTYEMINYGKIIFKKNCIK